MMIWDPTPTSEPSLIFGDDAALVKQVFGRRHFEEMPARQTGYVNLRTKNTTRAQIHSLMTRHDGVGLAIPDVDELCPRCETLDELDLATLEGYKQATCRRWLLGHRRKQIVSPARAFLIPNTLKDNPGHPGWRDVDALLDYALNR